ncbi:MAG: flagellar biosynthesis protein FlhF [Planctomycetaceae bacterium]|nr:flagellar biosynthesis protein FlhF [Planctomycetaceae bacterium]
MQIKTFRAKSMPQALELVRDELGPTATVLHAREVNSGLIARMVRGKQYEIAATVDGRGVSDDEPIAPLPRVSPAAAAYAQHATTAVTPTATSGPATAIAHRDPHLPSTQLAELEDMVHQFRQRSAPTVPNDDAPPLADAPVATLLDVFGELIERDVDEDIAREVIEQLAGDDADFDRPADRLRLAQLIADRLATSGPVRVRPGQTRVVAMVGPTGVGKTTTIAKLAANMRLREGRRVGLITVDTYRIAAVEQLRTYADIIDLPLEVVGTPREMREAVARLQGYDVVFIDTAGRSPRDDVQIRELRSLLAEAQPDEVHLVLSATSSGRSLASAVRQFAPAEVTHLLVTKLDEVEAPGGVLQLARKTSAPLSYVTHGQHVPDDIAVADAAVLGEMIAAEPVTTHPMAA